METERLKLNEYALKQYQTNKDCGLYPLGNTSHNDKKEAI